MLQLISFDFEITSGGRDLMVTGTTKLACSLHILSEITTVYSWLFCRLATGFAMAAFDRPAEGDHRYLSPPKAANCIAVPAHPAGGFLRMPNAEQVSR